MSRKLDHNKQGLSPIARGVLARTVDSFKMNRQIAAAKKAPYHPYGEFAESLGIEATVSHVEMVVVRV
jgi:hypothetical protein